MSTLRKHCIFYLKLIVIKVLQGQKQVQDRCKRTALWNTDMLHILQMKDMISITEISGSTS